MSERESPAEMVARIGAELAAHRKRASEMLAELAARNPPRSFDTILSGKVKGPPLQLEMFGGAKLAKSKKPPTPDFRLFPKAREREELALQLRRAGKSRREIAAELKVTPRAVSRYFDLWRKRDMLPPAVIGRPRQS